MNAKYGRKRIDRAIEEYQMDQLFQQMMRERKTVVQCPGCSVATEKSEGCNKMKCSLCKTDFCFNCGSKIGNNHDHFVDPSSPCYKLLFLACLVLKIYSKLYIHINKEGTRNIVQYLLGCL